MAHNRNTGWRIVKWASIGLGIIILLLISLVLFISTPYGQKVVKNQGEKYLRNKLRTNLSIGSFRIGLSTGIHFRDIYLEDQEKRSLLSIHQLDVIYDLQALLLKNITLNEIIMQGVQVNLYRNSSSDEFNFDFIPEAFSSGEPEPVGNTPSAFTIKLGKIHLDSVSFLLDDQYAGQRYEADINEFKTDLAKSDLEKMIFHAGYIFSDGLNVNAVLKQTGKVETASDTSTSSASFQFVSDTLGISKASIRFESVSGEPITVVTGINSLNAKGLDYRSGQQSLVAGFIKLKDHSTNVETRSSKTPGPTIAAASTSKPFRFKIDSVAIENNNITYADNAFPKLKNKSIDFHHLGIAALNIHAAKISSDGNSYAATINDLSATEAGGFMVRELKGTFGYSDTAIQLQNLFLKTSGNQLTANANVKILKTRGRQDNYGIRATMSTPGLNLREAIYFKPELAANKYFTPLLNKSIQLNTNIDGTLDQLHIRQLIIKEASTRINASANVKNLPDVDRMVIDLRLNELSSTRNDILALLPKGTIPDSMLHYIPEKIALKGIYRGSLQNIYTDLQLISSYGNASIKGTLKEIADKNKAVYDITASLRQLDLAAVLEDTTLGRVNGSLALNGKGYDPKSMVASFKVDIDSADYSGYTYQQVNIEGDIDHNQINADIRSEDPNAEVDGNFSVNLNEGSRALKTNTHIRHLDLNKLGFMLDTLALRGDITADFPMFDTSGITGKLLVSGTTVNYKGREINMDTLTIDARSNLDSQLLRINSPYTDINMPGRYRLQDLPAAVQTVINHYFLTDKSKDTIFHKDVDVYLRAKINIPDSVAVLIPGLRSIAPFDAISKLTTSSNELVFLAIIPSVKYGDTEIDTLVAGVTTYSTDGSHYENLKYGASLKKLTGPSYKLENSYLEGGAMKGIIDGSLAFLDENRMPRYKFPFVFTNDPQRPNIVIPDSLMINEKKWFVKKDNRIYLDTKHLSGSLLTIGNNETTIELKTSDHNPEGLPLELRINQFHIRDLSEILISDTALANGTINGHLDISSLTPLRFTTDIRIDSLEVLRSKLGNLRALVQQEEKGIYQVNTTLNNDHNDVSLVGTYNADEKNANLDLKVQNFHLGDLKPITDRYLADLDGNLKGELTINGSFEEPISVFQPLSSCLTRMECSFRS